MCVAFCFFSVYKNFSLNRIRRFYIIGLIHPLFEAFSMLYLIFKVAAFLLKYSLAKERYVQRK